MAIGFAFLIAPSGWIFRLLAAAGIVGHSPPDLATVQDPHGLSLILGLSLKEVPSLLLRTLVAFDEIRLRESMTLARALGHARSAAWLAVVLPQIYPQLRLPIYAVLAYVWTYGESVNDLPTVVQKLSRLKDIASRLR